MNKVVLKEFENKHILVDIIFYTMIAVFGFVLLNFSDIGLKNPIKYAPCIFYTIAFLSICAYFSNRRKNDYEFLFFGFINVVVGTFILVYTFYPNSGFILADAVLLYSISNILNKGYSCKKLLEQKNVNFFTKASITILLLFLGVFVVASLYNKVEVGIMILGYYFITFGLLSLLEPLNEILLDNPTLKDYILNILSYSKKEEPIIEKEVEVEKPVRKVAKKSSSSKKSITKKKATVKKKVATKTIKKTNTKKTKK